MDTVSVSKLVPAVTVAVSSVISVVNVTVGDPLVLLLDVVELVTAIVDDDG